MGKAGKGSDVVAYLQDWERKAGFDLTFQWNAEGTQIDLDLSRDTDSVYKSPSDSFLFY